MDVRHLDDPAAFLADASELLLADEARHNLMLGIAGTLRDHPGVYPQFELWLVEDAGSPVAAALQTPPYNLALARPAEREALAVLARALHADGVALPGVTAALPEADAFAEEWERLTDVTRRRRMAQRIYRLTELCPVRDVPGRPRRATPEDRSLLVEWIRAFSKEAVPQGAPGRAPEAGVDARLEHGSGGFMLWEDGGPVSLAGWGGLTPSGVRIGPVYTPPRHRRRGYASAVTAAVSAEQLSTGRRFCFLYTDLANPTSNRIYTEIGYEQVCNSLDYAFEPR